MCREITLMLYGDGTSDVGRVLRISPLGKRTIIPGDVCHPVNICASSCCRRSPSLSLRTIPAPPHPGLPADISAANMTGVYMNVAIGQGTLCVPSPWLRVEDPIHHDGHSWYLLRNQGVHVVACENTVDHIAVLVVVPDDKEPKTAFHDFAKYNSAGLREMGELTIPVGLAWSVPGCRAVQVLQYNVRARSQDWVITAVRCAGPRSVVSCTVFVPGAASLETAGPRARPSPPLTAAHPRPDQPDTAHGRTQI